MKDLHKESTDVSKLDPKHWVVTRCGKLVIVKNHSVREFSWEFADIDQPDVYRRCKRFNIDKDGFTLNHPKLDSVEDAIAEQVPYYYWIEPGNALFSILNITENESKMIFLKSNDIDLLVGNDNWTTVAKEHPAYMSFNKRLEMLQGQSDVIQTTLYMLGEDNGWLLLYAFQGNLHSESIKVSAMMFHSDPLLQMNTQSNWERHGNKTLYLAFSKKSALPNLQDSIWLNVGWNNSPFCLRSNLKISSKLVNDNREKS